MAQHFNGLDAFKRHLQDMERSISPTNRRLFLKRVMGETIRDMIKVSFLAGKDPAGELWKSPAAETQHGGRWAASYKTRPSGDEVTSDKIRLTDSGQLAKSYKVIEYDADHVTVGPKGQRRNALGQFATNNEKIAERAEEDWGNQIAGFGPDGGFRQQIINLEINKVWEHYIQGIPISKIRKPRVRAM